VPLLCAVERLPVLLPDAGRTLLAGERRTPDASDPTTLFSRPRPGAHAPSPAPECCCLAVSGSKACAATTVARRCLESPLASGAPPVRLLLELRMAAVCEEAGALPL